MTKKFTRNNRGRGTSDERGLVQISVRLLGKNASYVKGNIARSLSLSDATVTEVFAAIEENIVAGESG
jgi:hypothetical protein